MKIIKASKYIKKIRKKADVSIPGAIDASISAVGNFFINLAQGTNDLAWIGLARTERIPRFLAKVLAAGPAAVWRGLEVFLGQPQRKGMKSFTPSESQNFFTRLARFMNLRRPEDLTENAQRLYQNLLSKKNQGKNVPQEVLNFFKQKGKISTIQFGKGAAIVGDFVISPKVIKFLKKEEIIKDFTKKLKNDIPFVKGQYVYNIGDLWVNIPEVVKGGFVSAKPTTFYVRMINEVPVIVDVEYGDAVSWSQ